MHQAGPQWFQRHSALGSMSTTVSSASGRTDPELGWQGRAEAQKNTRRRWIKMHYFLGWDRECNHVGICLELHMIWYDPYDPYSEVWCVLAGLLAQIGLQTTKKVLVLKEAELKVFELSILCPTCSSSLVGTGQLMRCLESILRLAGTNGGVSVHCCVCSSSYSLWFSFSSMSQLMLVSDFTRNILQQKASQHYKLKFRSKYLVHPLSISFISYFFIIKKEEGLLEKSPGGWYHLYVFSTLL